MGAICAPVALVKRVIHTKTRANSQPCINPPGVRIYVRAKFVETSPFQLFEPLYESTELCEWVKIVDPA